MIWTVPKLWDGGDAWIIGGGSSMPLQFGVPIEIIQKVYAGILPPAAYSQYMKPLHDRHVIGINNVYQLGAWVDIIFFGDSHWYLTHRNKFLSWSGLKVCCDQKFINRPKHKMEGVKFLARDKEHREGIAKDPSQVSWNSNSGSAAISLAYHLGVKRIYLLGFDMTMDAKGRYSHWHGTHLPPGQKAKKTPPFLKHLEGFPAIAKDAKELGIQIFNISSISKIDCFPKISLHEALNG